MALAMPVAIAAGVPIPCFGHCGYGLQYSQVVRSD